MLYIITEYFHPFSEAGGPIRSIENILKLYESSIRISLLSSNRDYKGDILPQGINSNIIQLEPNTGYSIIYISNSLKGFNILFKSVKSRDTIYVNGLFKPSLNLVPILKSNKLIIAPRGMLQAPLLKQKWIQKNLYLSFLKFIFFFKKVKWHATTNQEAHEIRNIFGKKTKIKIISNIPVKPFTVLKKYIQHPQTLSLIYYGLIVENKGLLTLIQTLKTLNYPVSLDIYGSVKDQAYWKLCQQQINNNDSLASFYYKGHANPADSQTILAGYDALVLLTKGENFGHSIYEALSVGTPVIISDKTPWVFEESATPAGWLVNYANNEFDIVRLKQVVEDLYNMDNNTYSLCSANAHKYAVDFYNAHDFKAQYTSLFNSFN